MQWQCATELRLLMCGVTPKMRSGECRLYVYITDLDSFFPNRFLVFFTSVNLVERERETREEGNFKVNLDHVYGVRIYLRSENLAVNFGSISYPFLMKKQYIQLWSKCTPPFSIVLAIQRIAIFEILDRIKIYYFFILHPN